MKYREFLDEITRHPLNASDSCSCHHSNQKHVHEFEGSTRLAEEEEDRHNHRFAGVTGEAILVNAGKHVHNFESRTDFFENHHHFISGRTGPNIELPNGKHIHYVNSFTTVNDGHRHQFEFASLIGPSPLT